MNGCLLLYGGRLAKKKSCMHARAGTGRSRRRRYKTLSQPGRAVCPYSSALTPETAGTWILGRYGVIDWISWYSWLRGNRRKREPA